MNKKYLSIAVITSIVISLFSPALVLAKSKKPQLPDKFPPNPLEIKKEDPLLPSAAPKEPLTRQEKRELEAALDDLNQQAIAKFEIGDKQGAFDIWNREIRLRRYLGIIPEIQALSRVGAIAWRQNNRQQVFYITQRLQKIQKNQTKSKSKNRNQRRNSQEISSQANNSQLEVLQALGEAYQQVRTPKEALQVYERVLSIVRERRDNAQEVEVLNTIGKLHLAWFDYDRAAVTYEELLGLANTRGEDTERVQYLEELAYIYEKTQQPQKSLNVRRKLTQIYSQGNNQSNNQQDNQLNTQPNTQIKLSALKIAIGSDYESLAKKNPAFLDEAFKNYQEAYIIAWKLQQYVRAGEALQKLIALYTSQGQMEEALQTSKILIETARKAANLYNLMNAYDQIAKLYLQRQDYPQAMEAFQQGLQLARQLQHQEKYFTEEINKLSSKINN
ncbi:tetratricopeptide repeat protein [Mastigocoleus testarum]|uniref:MalT-like TPR region domain-containing protein n=1 Tax=Mastigocoleus testarum BC008 TaxID=371196 RepID=A0A0V7ZJ53_9CYAN|nr:tetratricopeptide repeat protein [Mastigocoleus testarum]KST64428.1 hypothetical protein BC008_17505 [Mastigocoleus testarum BC008]